LSVLRERRKESYIFSIDMAQPRRKPSERPKRRYVVFEVAGSEPFGVSQVDAAIQHSLGAFKDKGMRFVHDTWDSEAKQGIVRINHTQVKQLCDALNSMDIHQASVKTIGMSGILRQAKLKFMKNKSIKKENKRNYHHRV
jgi:RNase P/RNase MRP subunit POP5